MGYLYNLRRRTRITMANSSPSPQLTVEFDFLVKSENIVVHLAESLTRSSGPDSRVSVSVPVLRGEPPTPSLNDIMATAVSGAVAGCPLTESNRRGLVNLALMEARRRLTTPPLADLGFGETGRVRTTTAPPEHGYVLCIEFEIRITHCQLHVRDGGAPELEEVEVREGEGEKGCCICLEEIIGGASRMPCLHVFHGGCIREWLRKSRCCPLCRYQLAAATTYRQRRTDDRGSGG